MSQAELRDLLGQDMLTPPHKRLIIPPIRYQDQIQAESSRKKQNTTLSQKIVSPSTLEIVAKRGSLLKRLEASMQEFHEEQKNQKYFNTELNNTLDILIKSIQELASLKDHNRQKLTDLENSNKKLQEKITALDEKTNGDLNKKIMDLENTNRNLMERILLMDEINSNKLQDQERKIMDLQMHNSQLKKEFALLQQLNNVNAHSFQQQVMSFPIEENAQEEEDPSLLNRYKQEKYLLKANKPERKLAKKVMLPKSTIIITKKKTEDSFNVMKLRDTLKDIKEIDSIAVTKIRPSNNKLEIRCHNEEEKDRLKEILQNSGNLENYKIQNKNPLTIKIIFFNIPQDLTEEKFKELLHLGKEEKDLITLQEKRSTKYRDFEHWIFNVPNFFARLIFSRHVYLGIHRIYFRKFIRLQRCLRCQQFGHSANYCKNSNFCSNCSGNHEWKQCSSTKLNCINCQENNEKHDSNFDLAHSAADYKCPSFLALRDYLSSKFKKK